MSYMKLRGAAAATVTALALAGVAYGDTGKSPNGVPGPAGNPNPPAAQPQANGPQGPAGNDARGRSQDGKSGAHGKGNSTHGKSNSTHGKSNSTHGKSDAHGKSGSTHGKSHATHGRSHANPAPGTPRKGGREDRPAGKITICHATKSATNPYVEITISVNGLHGHGPAADPRHHEGSWQDIIPAPAGGCPSTAQQPGSAEQPAAPKTQHPESGTATPQAPADGQAVLGAQAQGGNAPEQSAVLGAQAEGNAPGQSGVLGAQAAGDNVPASALAAREQGDRGGQLPFTGLTLAVLLIAAAALLLGGFALRRATAAGRA